MADQDPKTPDRGPVPDPHADKPPPRPDPHTRPEPGAQVRRPDQDEDLGPVAELFGAAGLEAATVVSDDLVLREEAIRRGAETEGVETAQIFGFLLATAVVLVMIVVVVAVMTTRTGTVEEQRRLGTMAYPELEDMRHAEQEQLSGYGRIQGEDRFFVPLERAQMLIEAEARHRREVGESPDAAAPDSRIGFNLSYARAGVPGLVPAPGSPAARVSGLQPVAPAEPAEDPLEAEAPDGEGADAAEPGDAPTPPVN